MFWSTLLPDKGSMKRILLAVALLSANILNAQQPVSQQVAATIMAVAPHGRGHVWNYEEGTSLVGMDAAWYATANGDYFRYIQQCVDRFVDDDGTIKTYKGSEFTLDNIQMGRQLLLLYAVTGQKKYFTAATTLYDQLKHQPRTAEGGFWHKQRYPNQMWLDGLYMAEPFYAEYAATFHHPEDFDDIVHQFQLIDEHARDPKTGLYFHAWDSSKQQKWANPQTGDSAILWSRAMGWYAMALVDTLDYLPAEYPGRAKLISILNRFAKGIIATQDSNGVWYQVTDRPHAPGNFEESSGSAMFVYALAKGVRMGYLPASDQPAAKRGFAGLMHQFVTHDAHGMLVLSGTCDAVGLGGTPYRDGTYRYYTTVSVVSNDGRGLGPMLLASREIEMMPTVRFGKGHVALLDSWFNSQTHADITGAMIPYHYKWQEQTNDGFSFMAHAFHTYGVSTRTLDSAPTAANLAGASVYLIVDPNFATTPSNPHYNPHPNLISSADVKAITDWVRRGGTLLLFGNDRSNLEFEHLNTLASQFGITFNQDIRNRVPDHQYEAGAFTFEKSQTLFHAGLHIFMKEICTIGTKAPAHSILSDHGDTIIAVSRLGKGRVFAVGDPWLYNEYTDGRKLPSEFQNYQAALDLVHWSIEASGSHNR